MSTLTLDRSTMRSVFAVPLTNLLLISRQIHDEVKDLVYSTVPFTIDVRKDGTFMCGRRLLEPRRADGSSHYIVGDVEKIKERFLKTFDWAAVKNYNVDILVENWKDDTNRGYHTFPWDEEVEIYDIRDYIGVVVSGILSKARNLCKLNVRLGFSKFQWTEEELHSNIKTLVGPFERLRNVRQPRILGVYEGTPQTNFMISLPVPSQVITLLPVNGPGFPRPATPLCSVPQLPTKVPLLVCDQSSFIEYCSNWERWISSSSTGSLVGKPPIRAMFTELKDFYTRLAATIPDVTARNGRYAFLHRARVAREQENVEAFRNLRNELINYWEAYLEQEERKKDDMNRRLGKMLEADVYPSVWDEEHACIASRSNSVHPTSRSNSQSPIITNAGAWSAANKSTRKYCSPSQTGSHIRASKESRPSNFKSMMGSSAQSPICVDSAEVDRLKDEAFQDLMQHHQQQQQHRQNQMMKLMYQQNQRQHLIQKFDATQDMASPSDRVSPSSSRATLQSPKDQQPMALNPQLHLEAAMSHRRHVEMQAHQARTMQGSKQRYELQHAERAGGSDQQSHCGRLPPNMHTSTMSTIPTQQMQTHFSDMAVHPKTKNPNESDTSLSSLPESAPMEFGRSHEQQDGTSSYTETSSHASNWNITIPNGESATGIYEEQQPISGSLADERHMQMMPVQMSPMTRQQPSGVSEAELQCDMAQYEMTMSRKRSVSEANKTEEWDMMDGKRQRVDSGMGWSNGGSECYADSSEEHNVTGVAHGYHGQHNAHQEWVVEAKIGGGMEVHAPAYIGKGKGKARADEPGRWLQEEGFTQVAGCADKLRN